MEKLSGLPDFILTGDFNAPRGRATWDTLAAKYKDNIPARYTSSIDPSHRAGESPYVVDGIFTTPEYEARNVELHEGISDHKAVTATVVKV
jgi:endonuclease/exonuclease/phosphatase family metal-dependent hydrolase